MLLLQLGWVACAWASPGSAGAVHLGALPFEGGFVGFGGGVAWTPDGAAAAPLLEGGAALSDRWAVTAMAGVTLPEVPVVPGLVSARYLAVNQDHVHFAVTAQLTALPFLGRFTPSEVHLDPGVAIDAGGPRVRFDAAVPLWGLSEVGGAFGPERFPVPELSTLGVDFLIADHQRLRIGLPELLSWSWRGEHAYFDLGGVTILAAGAVWTKAGVVF